MDAPGATALESARTPPHETFWISLGYFNLYRIVVAALFLGATVFYGEALNIGSHQLVLFRYVGTAYLLLGIVFQGVLRNLRDRFDLQLTVHVCTDILAITLLMYSSGGLRSGLGVMMLISLIGAALVAPARLTYLYAAIAAIALLLEQSYWTLVHDAPTANYLQPGLLAIGCFASSGVTGWLAQRVTANERLARQRGRELHTQMRVNQLVIEDMQDGVLVIDRDGRVVQHNPQALRLLGAARLRGSELGTLVKDFAAWWTAWRTTESGPGGPQDAAEFTIRGRPVRLRLMETGTDEEFGVVFVEDLTRTQAQAQQLKLAALGRLTANIAHEIRNPLAAISHAAELLDEGERGQDQARLSKIIHDNARRLDRLVSDVLQLNRRDRVAAENLHLGAWLVGFVEEFVANEGVPPERFEIEADGDWIISFDRDHLRQVLWNLLRNAVRFSPAVPRGVRIVVSGYADQVELSVIDCGPGVPAADQGQLFEPFFTTDSKGTGLGLYLARELCAANGAVLEYVDGAAGAHFRLRGRGTVAP